MKRPSSALETLILDQASLTLTISLRSTSSDCALSAHTHTMKVYCGGRTVSHTLIIPTVNTHAYRSSPLCALALSQVWHLLVWWSPRPGEEPDELRRDLQSSMSRNVVEKARTWVSLSALVRFSHWGRYSYDSKYCFWSRAHLLGELLSYKGHDKRRLPHFGWRKERIKTNQPWSSSTFTD